MEILKQKEEKEMCPYSTANIFSKATVWWMNPYFKTGYQRKILFSDLYKIDDKHQASYLTKKLSENWIEECKNAEAKGRKPSFSKAFWKTFSKIFIFFGFLVAITELLRGIGPFFIGHLSRYFINPEEESIFYAYLCATGLMASSLFYVTLDCCILQSLQTLGWNAKSAVVGLMYEKEEENFQWTLKLNHEALSKTTSGRIVNLSSTDALRYQSAFAVTHYLWIAPLECIIVTYLLYQYLGPAGVVGTVVLFIIMILQTIMGKKFGKLRLRIASITDDRVHTTNEAIAGMRIVKLYSWEKWFAEVINSFRRKEMQNVLYASLLRSVNYTLNHSVSQILAFATFLSVVVMDGYLDLELVLVSLGLFTVVLLGAGLVFPYSMERFFEVLAALKRTEKFLLLPEISPREENEPIAPAGVVLEDFSGSWTKSGPLTLQSVSVEVQPRKLIMVIGPVGAGKSSLLSAILGELPVVSGSIQVRGKVAYASQLPWLFSDTVRNNILFGQEFEANRYKRVVTACALKKDFAIFPSGDRTLVGERGITLSGGQKARVSLARLAYRSNFDIAVMDDPLSAVDTVVANHLFEKCICGLLENKICILVTHQLQFLAKADEILVMKKGRVVDRGTFIDLSQRGTDFASLLKVENEEDPDQPYPLARQSYRSSCQEDWPDQNDDLKLLDETVEKTEKDIGSALIIQPSKESNGNRGKVMWKVYREFFAAGLNSLFFIILLVVVVIGSHVTFILIDWWLAKWSVASGKYNEQLNNLTLSTFTNATSFTSIPLTVRKTFDQQYYLYVYAILTVSFFVLMFSRTAMHFYLCVRSSVKLHAKMLSSLFRAKIRFFDTNPVGAVLNRFSKDMNQVDERLPLIVMDVFFNIGTTLAIVLFVVSINYFVIIIVIPLSIYLVWIRRYFVATSRELKRIEGEERSPLFSLLSASLRGLVTIRTFQVQQSFIAMYHRLQDAHGAAWTACFFGSRWFAYRLDVATAIFIGTTAFFSVLITSLKADDWFIDPGSLGLTLTYSTSLLIWFQWGIRQSAEAENLMTSVERIHDYHHLPEEEVLGEKPSVSLPNWPENGSITFADFSYAYYESGPLVLRNINLEIKSKEKLGVVGRTGAGKSSLVAALFRMSDHVSGLVMIDGINAAEVRLHEWRKAITIIPQDPVLFGGTMRKNLDPFSSYTDEQLWNALEKVQLKFVVESLPLKLQSPLTESGSNLSVGQRQLVCLARAMLRNNRILIIDEATANVDNRTDRVIQEIIRSEFRHCTVLTIAHRLDTIIDSDRILVMDKGEIVECDAPHVLLQNSAGALSELVRVTGCREHELRKLAEAAYLQRRNVTNTKYDATPVNDQHESRCKRKMVDSNEYEELL